MKFSGDGSENRCKKRKGFFRMNSCHEGNSSGEKKEISGMRGDEGESGGVEPSATALIPPWIRNSFGLADKDTKQNQKCIQIYNGTEDRPPCIEMKADSMSDGLKCHHSSIHNSPRVNPGLEVNIASKADFIKDSSEKSYVQSQHESGCILGVTKEPSNYVPSEVTSIDVVVPAEEHEIDKRKYKSHKGKWKISSKSGNVCSVSDENVKSDAEKMLKSSERDFFDEYLKLDPPKISGKFDSRLLLLCGKKTVDELTQEDIALLQEMKNQIGHKEGFEKLFTEIKETAFPERGIRKPDRKEEKDTRKEDKTTCHCKSDESRATTKTRVIDEERSRTRMTDDNKSKTRVIDDERRHYKRSQQKHKYTDEQELEKDKKSERWKGSGHRLRDVHSEKEKKSKLRHCDYSAVEKAVTETMQKFINLHQIQVPPDVVNNMKKNIIQSLQGEYQEVNVSKKCTDIVALSVQDQLKNSIQFLVEDPQKLQQDFTSEENFVSKDIPAGDAELTKARMGIGRAKALKSLRKDFETSLELIQQKVDLSGAKLCCTILEKNAGDDKKLRIIHNFSSGVTETVKIYDITNKGSPEGDHVNANFCICHQNFLKKRWNQCCQTRQIKREAVSTQTDLVDVSVKHFRSADLTPGLYRISKAPETGRFYLTAEVLEGDELEEDREEAKRVSSELCVSSGCKLFKNELLKYVSRETFISERWNSVGENKKLWRSFRSDCLGLNNSSSCAVIKTVRENIITDVREVILGQEKKEILELEMEGDVILNASQNLMAKNDAILDENILAREGYHRECVWYWNGKKISPGIDLKDHVEDLLREKLNEILFGPKVTEIKKSAILSALDPNPKISGNNFEIRKTEAKFCITNQEHFFPESSLFIFKASPPETGNAKAEVPAAKEDSKVEKSVREVGTQNSRHSIAPLDLGKLKGKSVTKRKQSHHQKCHRANSKFTETSRSLQEESVGEAKKAKLEFRNVSEIEVKRARSSDRNSDSVRECLSVVSNGSSSANERPVRIKLIGIEVSKEKTAGERNPCTSKGSEAKSFVVEGYLNLNDEEKKYKHWEIIENVLNRVNDKEKDFLWNDIRDFVKKKIGKDINEEGAREVCIEIEQEVPKYSKDRASRMVVAKGNYRRSEGDVEVEVDLTLEDLERILRHRQRKHRRRTKAHSHKSKVKEFSSSSETISKCNTYKCRSSLGEDYITNSEAKMLK